ncbi:MRN complex-interacting protein-like isoform X2 [Mercenaria mercenaria]|nr:MRN complex-interacting protein-like isoform X2 [Mercenaria mercenaria]
MPQEFQVLQCYSCQTFQVHQVKKATKWTCKMCGEKQSLKKVFGRGSGAECRQHVQRLNTLRAELDYQSSSTSIQSYVKTDLQSEDEDCIYGNGQNYSAYDQCPDVKQHNKETKWNMFVERTHSDLSYDDEDDSNDRYTTDAQKFKHGRKRKRTYQKRSSDYSTEYTEDTMRGTKSRYQNENCPENNFSNSSPRRKEWYTSELSEPSSQESTAGTFSGRIQVQSYSSRNLDIEQSGDENHEINTRMNTKWSMFTETDTSSQESSTVNSQGPAEDLYDARWYVTFEPEEAEHLAEPLSTTASRRVKNDINSTKSNGCSKWTGFITCEENVEQSGQNNTSKQTGFINCENDTVHSGQNTFKQTGFVTRENIVEQSGGNNTSKWTGFLSVKENVSSSRQNLGSLDIDEKENLNFKLTAYAGERKNEVLNGESKNRCSQVSEPMAYNRMTLKKQSQCTEAFKDTHVPGNTGRFDRIENVNPVFTVGDLDDDDFEL